MLTEDLHKAFAEIEKLETLLEKNEWTVSTLSYDLERADKKVTEVIRTAINETVYRLRGYEEEAALWTRNRMRGSDGKHININKQEQEKAKTQLKHIQKTMITLKEMLDEE